MITTILLTSAVLSVLLFLGYILVLQRNTAIKFPELSTRLSPVTLILFLIAMTVFIVLPSPNEAHNSTLPQSSYKIVQTSMNDNKIGYAIQKNGGFVYLAGNDDKKSYAVYSDFESALKDMNRMEQFDHVQVTNLR